MPTRPLLSLLLTALAAVAAPACGIGDGGGESIPPGVGEVLLADLQSVEEAVAAGDCETAQQDAEAFSATLAELPADVPGDVEAALVRGAERLVELANDPDQCAATGATGATDEQTTTTETEPVEPVEPTTTTTTTTEQETTTDQPPDKPEPAQPPPQPTPPPSGGGGQDGGSGGTGGTGGTVTPRSGR